MRQVNFNTYIGRGIQAHKEPIPPLNLYLELRYKSPTVKKLISYVTAIFKC